MDIQYQKLLYNLKSDLKEIDHSTNSHINKSSQKIQICHQAIQWLRDRYLEDSLSKNDQVNFFKNVKSEVFAELLYQLLILDYYKNRPKGGIKDKKDYINDCLKKQSGIIADQIEFSHYIGTGATHLDDFYFTQRPYDLKLHGSLEYPIDLEFSSPADLTLSKLISTERMIQFLKNELFSLKNPYLDPTWNNLDTLNWKASKIDLVELVYALYASKCVEGELKDLISVLERTFKIDLGNFYRIYTDIKYKKNPTAFLDQLKSSLKDKINLENQ